MRRAFAQVLVGVLVTSAAILAPVRVAGAEGPPSGQHAVQTPR